MRIALFDPYTPRFTADMVAWWSMQGHEVKVERYYNPELVDWADLIWFETCDNNLNVASFGMVDNTDWPLSKRKITGKKVIVRVIDIEAWYGHHLNVDWNYVSDVIFLAPHIQKVVEKDIDFSKTNTRVHLIPCGLNLDRFGQFQLKKTAEREGNKIAWVCEKWPTKGIDYALQIMAHLPPHYELHALGPWNDRYAWEKAYQEDFIQRNNIKFFDYEWIEDLNEFFSDKDFILSCSKKEAFGYSIAEGMAAGLKPVIHTFYGGGWLWDFTGNLWDTIEEAVELIDGTIPEKGDFYRQQLIAAGYTLEHMMSQFNEVING